jgi:hypothetical protein
MNKPRRIIPRSMAGLRDVLFETLEKLRDREMEADEAREMANVARVILESIEVQVDFEELKLESKVPQRLPEMHVVPAIAAAIEPNASKPC